MVQKSPYKKEPIQKYQKILDLKFVAMIEWDLWVFSVEVHPLSIFEVREEVNICD